MPKGHPKGLDVEYTPHSILLRLDRVVAMRIGAIVESEAGAMLETLEGLPCTSGDIEAALRSETEELLDVVRQIERACKARPLGEIVCETTNLLPRKNGGPKKKGAKK